MLLERLAQGRETFRLKLVEAGICMTVVERTRDQLQGLLRSLRVEQDACVVVGDGAIVGETLDGRSVELNCAAGIACSGLHPPGERDHDRGVWRLREQLRHFAG